MATRHTNPRDKAAVVKWAQDLLQLSNFYVLDTETTGVSKQDQICQIGIIDKNGDVVLDTLVKPTVRISSGASAVNGISDKMVKDAPTLMDVYTDISSMLAGSTLIAYNMDFDWRMLKQSVGVYKMPMFRVTKKECAMKQYAKYRGVLNSKRRGYRWHKLTDAADYEKLLVANAHTALGDVIMTLELIKKMAGIESDSPAT
ncbi:MAG: 3'-5' exonuclease [Anaerolineae bacterium]|nr:3'-5' exonuclease [Anaerolineae bacterium]